MSDVKLGNIISTEQNRDAIHVAVAPVFSEHIVYPGQHVGLKSGSATVVELSKTPIGIVDPFLTHPVMPGQRFWLLLYQQTVTGMRHEWKHPAFGEAADDSKLAYVAGRCGCSVEGLMDRLDLYADDSCGPDDSIQTTLNGLNEHEVKSLWSEYEKRRVTTVSESIKGNTYFRCAC